MNTIPGLRAGDLSLPGAAGWPSPATDAGSAHATSAQRWLDGLAGANDAVLTADLPPGAAGLSADAHAQRVLAALLDD